jgi:Mrp family chromosome partitioning ATPase
VKVLAEIPARPSPELRTGSLRRGDLEAYGGLLEELAGARCVLATGNKATTARTVAVGLAATAASRGSRVVLVEGRLANPGLAEALGLAPAPGLHDYLRGTADSEAILKSVVLAGPGSAGAVEPLVCVVAGRPSGDGAHLLASDALARALAGLRGAYELVVVDGPPLRDENSLRPLLPLADATIACLGPEEPRSLPITVSGVVIQRS